MSGQNYYRKIYVIRTALGSIQVKVEWEAESHVFTSIRIEDTDVCNVRRTMTLVAQGRHAWKDPTTQWIGWGSSDPRLVSLFADAIRVAAAIATRPDNFMMSPIVFLAAMFPCCMVELFKED